MDGDWAHPPIRPGRRLRLCAMALSDDTVGAIKTMIVDGRLRAGDKLPIERKLAAELGVSRGTLREAVRSLTMVGVLDTRQGDGTYVTSLEPRLLLGSL